MDFEFFIIIALIVIFFVSCCGLIQKLKENYDDDRGRVISAAHISPMQCPNQIFNNSAYQPDDFSSGVYPAVIAPPPYLEHLDPPPRYEDLVKGSQFTAIQMNQTNNNTSQTRPNPESNGTQESNSPPPARRITQ